MPLNLFLSSQASPRHAFVSSVANPLPQRLPDLVLGDSLSTNLYIVDGAGGYDAISGDGTYFPKVAIGSPGADPAWLSTDWTPVANGWNGRIDLNTTDIAALFNSGYNPARADLEVMIIDQLSTPRTYGLAEVKIFNRVIDNDALAVNSFMNSLDGVVTIAQGADNLTVTGLALNQLPRAVLPFLVKPVGGLNLWANYVDGTLSKDGFQVTLSGQTDGTGYKLRYVLFF